MNFHERFKLLAIFHYVVAGLSVLCGCFPLIHVTMGLLILSGSFGGGPDELPPEFGLLFVGVGAMMSILMWALAAATALAGYNLRAQRAYTFCLVVAAVLCLFMPLGTALGVFTIITLVDPKGKAMFDRADTALTHDEPGER